MTQSLSIKPPVLVMGYGNPGRQDDGLGPAFVDILENRLSADAMKTIQLQSNYQLTVEDAYELQNYNTVIFVDASINVAPPYALSQIKHVTDEGLGSHTLSPNGVLKLCETLYQHHPKAFILAIRGYEFDSFEEKLSPQAEGNLELALEHLATLLDGVTESPEAISALEKDRDHA